MTRQVLGLDIGGANLKAAHSDGTAYSQPFALWKNPSGLAAKLRKLLDQFGSLDLLVVTMTGELCDCYETKRQGVVAILDAVAEAARGIPTTIWCHKGGFITPEVARKSPREAAAANWLGLATFAGRFAASGPAIMIDIGSTTTDMVPLLDGHPVPEGRTDFQRLQWQELVYTGIRRTPLCALLGGAAAAEWFATTLDVYLALGRLPEDPTDCDTADGRPATRSFAHARLARMFCGDGETATAAESRGIALQAGKQQTTLLRSALETVSGRLPAPPATLVLAGSGEFLAKDVIGTMPAMSTARVVSLAEELGAEVSRAACAYALAILAAEGNHVL
jgi:probable H4MPT-linked C1 transfer pathway protein